MHVLLVNRMVQNINLNKGRCMHLIEFKVENLSEIC